MIQLLEPHTIIDRVVIQMAFVNRRLDARILSHVVAMPEPACEQIIIDLAQYPFVKARPQGIALHDEMRALITKHIWPKIDPMGLERHRLASIMVQYYDDQLVRYRTENIEQYWLLKIERLDYQLRCDLFAGYQDFVNDFDAASLGYRFGVRSLLLNEIESLVPQYSSALQFEIEIRSAKALFEQSRLKEAANKLYQLLGVFIEPEQQVETMILLGNVQLRLGETLEAIRQVEQALEIAKRIGDKALMGRAELALGWFHRIRGDWLQAFRNYENSLDNALASRDRKTLGLIFNNLAYITEFSNDHTSALGYSQQAIQFFNEIGAKRELAMCYSTLGEIFVYDGNYQKGYEYYQKALEVFEEQNDLEFLGIVYSQLSRTTPALGRFEEALTYAQRGVELCRQYSRQNLPVALHRLARVYEGLNGFEQAVVTYIEGQKVSEDLANSRYVMEHSVYLADVYYRYWTRSDNLISKEEYLDRIQTCTQVFEREAGKGIYVYPQDYLLGRIKSLHGNIQYDLEHFDEAIEIYKLAYYHIIIGSSDTYAANELNRFSSRIEQLPGTVALHWVEVLESFWKEKDILQSKPQSANFCRKHRIAALMKPQ